MPHLDPTLADAIRRMPKVELPLTERISLSSSTSMLNR
jgi:hypothetical protein